MPDTTPGRSRPSERYGDSGFRRLALAPALLATVTLLVGFALIEGDGFTVIRYVVAILALICAWFAFQARHWWWIPLLLAIAVVWNPVFVIPVAQPWWTGAQYLAIPVFVLAGVFIKVRVSDADARPT